MGAVRQARGGVLIPRSARSRRGKVADVFDPRVEHLGRFGGYEAFLVDGTRIRDEVEVDSVCGGNAGRYPSITPQTEVWIDQDMNPRDVAATVVHEVVEADLMLRRGWSYSRAHAEANVSERAFRAGRYRGIEDAVRRSRKRLGL